MTFSDFCNVASMIAQRIHDPFEAHYDGRAFGSWQISVVAGRRPVRLIWDGRDGWLVVQTAATVHSPGRDAYDWQDEWVGKAATDQTPEAALARVESLRT